MKNELIEELKEMSALSDRQDNLIHKLEHSLMSAIKTIECNDKVIVRLTEAIWSSDRHKITLAKLMTRDNGWCFMCGMYDCEGECND